MADGKAFNMTDKRIDELIDYLQRQYSVTYVARKWGITKQTLSRKIQELGLNVKKIKMEGVNTMKAELYDTIRAIEEPDKQAKARLDFLKHYDKSDDVVARDVLPSWTVNIVKPDDKS